jgi:hypothetical protein
VPVCTRRCGSRLAVARAYAHVKTICEHAGVARIDAPEGWAALRNQDDWRSHRAGLIVVDQRNRTGGEAPTKYGRSCKKVTNRIFLDGVATGTDNAEWFWVPDARAKAGGAVACQLCDGE